MVDRDASADLAAFAAELRYESIPKEVLEAAQSLLLNAIGVGLANRNELSVKAVLAAGGHESEEASVFGHQGGFDERTAALANGISIHMSDFDDTHAKAGIHPSAVIIPACLAVAESSGASGQALLRALVIGYEVMARIAVAAPHMFTTRGLHASSVCGALGAAAAVASLLELPRESIRDALGIAASQASGVLQTVIEGGDLKSFHLGWAAQAGIWAARLARHGLHGPSASIEGRQGLLNAFIQKRDAERRELTVPTGSLGVRWETSAVIIKPYPCCHFTHAAIDACLLYRSEFKSDSGQAATWLDSIERIVFSVPSEAVDVVCEPWASKVAPESAYAAKFSLPYCGAVALQYGEVRVSDFTASPEHSTRELMRRMSYVIDSDPELAHSYGAQVSVVHYSGEVWTQRIKWPTGSPRQPLSYDFVQNKFLGNATATQSQALSHAQAAAIADLSDSADVSRLMMLLRGINDREDAQPR